MCTIVLDRPSCPSLPRSRARRWSIPQTAAESTYRGQVECGPPRPVRLPSAGWAIDDGLAFAFEDRLNAARNTIEPLHAAWHGRARFGYRSRYRLREAAALFRRCCPDVCQAEKTWFAIPRMTWVASIPRSNSTSRGGGGALRWARFLQNDMAPLRGRRRALVRHPRQAPRRRPACAQ